MKEEKYNGWLNDKNIIKRSFAILGHLMIAQLIMFGILIGMCIVFGIMGIFIGVLL